MTVRQLFGFAFLREITNYFITSTLFLVKVIFFDFECWMVWNFKQEKPQRQRHRSTQTTSPRTFQRLQDINCEDVKPHGLGLTLSHWWKVLWILRSFKKIIYTVYSNILYPWYISKTKPNLLILTSPFSFSNPEIQLVNDILNNLTHTMNSDNRV